jgi:hypothetical protein
MRWRRIAGYALVFCGMLAVLAYARKDWALAHRRVALGQATRPTTYSTAECKRYCNAAFLPVAGISARTSSADLRSRMTSVYGAAAATVLMTEHDNGRALAADGKLFFPTRDLCAQKNLSGECAELCRRYNELH